MKEFFEAFFEKQYRFKYYTYDYDMISGHQDKTICYKYFPIDKCKLSFEEMDKIIKENKNENGCPISIENETYYIHSIEIYQPTFKITAEIREKLEDILIGDENLRSIAFCKDKDSYTYSLWEEDCVICNSIEKTRNDCVCKLCIQYDRIDEIYNKVRALFGLEAE